MSRSDNSQRGSKRGRGRRGPNFRENYARPYVRRARHEARRALAAIREPEPMRLRHSGLWDRW